MPLLKEFQKCTLARDGGPSGVDQILADQITLSQPGGLFSHITTRPLRFVDFPPSLLGWP